MRHHAKSFFASSTFADGCAELAERFGARAPVTEVLNTEKEVDFTWSDPSFDVYVAPHPDEQRRISLGRGLDQVANYVGSIGSDDEKAVVVASIHYSDDVPPLHGGLIVTADVLERALGAVWGFLTATDPHARIEVSNSGDEEFENVPMAIASLVNA